MLNFYILFGFLNRGKNLHPYPTFNMDPSLAIPAGQQVHDNVYLWLLSDGFPGKKLDQTVVTSVGD